MPSEAVPPFTDRWVLNWVSKTVMGLLLVACYSSIGRKGSRTAHKAIQ